MIDQTIHKTWWLVILHLAVLTIGFSPACSDSNNAGGLGTSAKGPAGSHVVSSTEIGPEVGQRAPNFALVTVNGTHVDLDTYKESPLLLYFYAVS